MDAMRVSLRVGAEKLSCIYRRSAAEAPARAEEIRHAHQEGVDFQWLTSPLALIGDAHKNVRAMRCERMELGEPHASGRRRPAPVPRRKAAPGIKAWLCLRDTEDVYLPDDAAGKLFGIHRRERGFARVHRV
jgi:hypothetical protein